MKRSLLLALTLAATTRVAAQQPSPGAPPGGVASGWGRSLVHYGKWATAAAALAFSVMAAREHTNSDRVFDQLFGICRANNSDCLLGPDGRYQNPVAEQLYQASLAFDRRARTRLLAGQAGLLITAGLFLADLRHKTSGPGNIPFNPLELSVDERSSSARLGIRVAF